MDAAKLADILTFPSHTAATRSIGDRVRTWLIAVLAVLLALATEQIIEHFARQSALEQERTSVLNRLSALRARLEGVINANLFLTHGLSAVIAAHPDIDQAGFSAIARNLVNERHALRNIAAAPGMVISLMYPLAGNEAALGLDYSTDPEQREAALRARNSGRSVIAGPVALKQGGVGIIAREPVFLPPNQPGGARRFWGLVSAVIDASTLYERAGLGEPDLRLALRGTDGTGARGPVFFGDPSLFGDRPVVLAVTLPDGAWQIAAIPSGGWGRANTVIDLIRLLGLLAGLTAAVLAYRLARRTQELTSYGARLRTLLNTIPDLVWLKDPDGLYLACNPGFEKFLGAREADILGKADDRFVSVDLAKSSRDKDRAAIAAGGPSVNEEWVTFASDGHRALLETIKTPVNDAAGRLLGVLGIARDITERKQAEQAVRESEGRYRLLLERAPFPAVLTRVRDGILLYGNHRAELQYGISRERGIGQPAMRFYEDAAQRERFLELMHKEGHVDDLELRMRTADGRPFWALVSASIVEFDNEPTIFAAINDITARKKTEAALQEQEEFFRLIAESMGDMVAVLDLEGHRLYNSPSYRALFGMPEAMKGTDSFAEIHPDDRERVREIFQETVRTGIGHRVNFRFLIADGSVRDIESQGGVIRAPDGRVQRVVVVSRDVTERKRLEDEIRQLNAELEQRVLQRTAELAAVNKELETFTYSVSHDLKAPLRGIDGYSRLLLEDHLDRLDEEGRLFLQNVRNGATQMSELIEDLLAYSRMERRSVHGQTLDLARQVTAVLNERQADIQARGMVVDVTLQGLTARADPEGLAMVLRNLVDNALKFTGDSQPPRLTIRGNTKAESAILEVGDNGIGFDMQFHDRIFDIFQRLQRAEDYPGTGIGLAIVQKAMQRMGGRIWAQSAPGQGATFYLELPR